MDAMPEPVRVRFAPSPTGHLHVGGARTALFNWAFARRHGGVFILRIEDTDAYPAHADRLLAEGKAYRCRCTPALLDSLRTAAQARGETFRYPGTCRDAAVPAGEPHALRLRVSDTGLTVVEDVLHGTVVFDHTQLDDWIIVRTDGTPTYNFCVVVDDVTMKITHVIRGDDHLSNTPKQVQCYKDLC